VKRQILFGALLAGLVLSTTVGAKLAAAAGMVSGDAPLRASQIFTGLIVAFYANGAPKRRSPLTTCDPARAQAGRRLAGWMLTLAGLGFALVWALAPVDAALVVAPAIVASAVAIVLGQCALTRLRRGGAL
jgi:hypothetical protein